ncbi:unnamed protein product [Caenorhabditis angaria]|uniref:Major facilitator superfamily (MFS) profile domain-containing protein n=1 Tax=Caenorhabditis angaria TaxID=860376 RepID=A0A9P1NA29_9PELO|nr:unnamed protein product [Caenorhabditis angaria]
MSSKRAVVFFVTFTSYGLYHASRKALSGVKSSIMSDWMSNSTHPPLFEHDADAKHFLGSLDAIFMTAYAAALFFWGMLGDRLNPKYVVAAGMVGSAVTLTLFGTIPKLLNFYSIYYYILTYIAFGLVQACGWPSEIAIMAAWFGKGNRGFIMGAWAACQPVGNIFGSIFTALVLPMGYEYTFLLNSLLILIGAIIVFISIDSKPQDSEGSYNNLEENNTRFRMQQLKKVQNPSTSHGEPISLIKALLLPGVLAYCICNACLKLVNYAFFFWLPLYLTDAYHWQESQADQLSIWYDFGGIIGSVVGGYITDKMGKRSPLIVGMLVCSIGSLFLYAHIGPHMLWNALVMTSVGFTVSGPYNLIVGSISIDLGSQPALAGNTQAMSTVSGLLDGTGSAGSAIGQVLIPVIQEDLGWKAVFYVFMVLNVFAILAISKRFIADMKSLRRIRNGEESPLLDGDDEQHED